MSARGQQIRARAGVLRAAYAAAKGLIGDILPVDELAELTCGLTAFDDPTLDMHINGELNTVIGSIRLRPGLPPPRRRFIIAHELGHYALEGAETTFFEDDDTTLDERAVGEAESNTDVLSSYNTRERHEQEANLFALELLVPADMLWEAVQQPGWTIDELVVRFGVSPDALLTQVINVCCLELVTTMPERSPATQTLVLNPDQKAAVDAPLPALVIAGPGTGKTRSIVTKYERLVERGVDPASILALTFSNKAAEEMRERIIHALGAAHPEVAARVEISTFHAWGLNFLRSYGHRLGLPLDAQLRSRGDLYVLLKRRAEELPLQHYRMLHEPGFYLTDLLSAVSRAKDELCTPAMYRRLAEAEAERLLAGIDVAPAARTTKKAAEEREKAQRNAARLLELSNFYDRYEALLHSEGILDYGDLIMRSVEALRLPDVAAEIQSRYMYILVDEFQDINYASGELVRLLDGGRGCVWAVGDPWQSIYRFRGASPANLQVFAQVYPGSTVASLDHNYRSLQPILDASHATMTGDPTASARVPLKAIRKEATPLSPVVEWEAPDAAAEHAAIAHNILRRTRGSRVLSLRCARGRPRKAATRNFPAAIPPARRRYRFADHVVLCRSNGEAARMAATLAAHGIPVDVVADIYARSEVKDALAVCALVRSSNSTALLRVLTLPEHALDPADFATLIRLAQEQRRSLPRAVRDPAILEQLSTAARALLEALQVTIGALSAERDAWQVLTRYLFAWSAAMRARLNRAAAGDWRARQELLALGQLIGAARTFVRQAPPAERDARSFVTYVRLLIEAGETTAMPPMPAGADVVRVMTVHAANGLEFPIVYVPGLQQGRFPPRPQGSAIPPLPGLEHGILPGAEQEEHYLLYVAMTRARDRLILTRAATSGEKPAARSVLLQAAGNPPPWPVRHVPAANGCPSPGDPVRLTIDPAIRMPVATSSLDTYVDCPRRFLYQYGYQLYDDASPYLRMHQTIRDAVARLSQLAREDALPTDEQALNDLVWGIFAGHELGQVVYARELFAEAMGHIRQVWNDLRTGVVQVDEVRQRQVVQRPSGELYVDVDRVEEHAGRLRWVRVRSGREGSDDHLDTRIMVYARAYEEMHQRPPDIAIHYTATGVVRSAIPQPAVYARHWEKIDEQLGGIAAARWDPKPGKACRTCPFNLICPV